MKSAVVDVNDVADYFIYKGKFYELQRGSISNLKLQKLLYYSQAWFYTLTGYKLFDEKVKAWAHGPVVPNIYYKYKKYGYNGITKKVNSIPPLIERNVNVKDVLKGVWRTYGDFSAKDLEKITHLEPPWQRARNTPSKEITVDKMKDHYKSYL